MIKKSKFINVTDITSYLICPVKVYFKKVKGLSEPKTKDMELGSFIHNIIENLFKNEEDLILQINTVKSYQEIKNLYMKYFKKIFINTYLKYQSSNYIKRIHKKYLIKYTLENIKPIILARINLIYRLNNLQNLCDYFLLDNLYPKIYTEEKLYNYNLGLVGKIDMIEIYPNNIAIPVEIKTGRILNIYKYQLSSYYLLLKSNFSNYNILRGKIIKLPKGINIEYSNLDKYEFKIREIISKIYDLYKIESIKDIFKKYKINIYEKPLCKKCYFRKYCKKIFKLILVLLIPLFLLI